MSPPSAERWRGRWEGLRGQRGAERGRLGAGSLTIENHTPEEEERRGGQRLRNMKTHINNFPFIHVPQTTKQKSVLVSLKVLNERERK